MRMTSFFAMLVLPALAALASACSRCNETTSAATDAAPASADVGPTGAPYLPARSAGDDSYAPNSLVESKLFSLRPGFNLCYRVAAQADPNLVAKTVWQVKIGPDGHPISAELKINETELPPDFIDCIKRVLLSADFKSTPDGGIATINVPIAFRPPAGGNRPDASIIGGGFRDAGR